MAKRQYKEVKPQGYYIIADLINMGYNPTIAFPDPNNIPCVDEVYENLCRNKAYCMKLRSLMDSLNIPIIADNTAEEYPFLSKQQQYFIYYHLNEMSPTWADYFHTIISILANGTWYSWVNYYFSN